MVDKIPLLCATDLPLGAADEAALVAVEVDGVGLHEQKVLVSLKRIESSDFVDVFRGHITWAMRLTDPSLRSKMVGVFQFLVV